MFLLGTGVISWTSKKQKIVALSLVEAQYMVGSSVVIKAFWLRRILLDLQQSIKAPTKMYYDNMSTIAMAKI